MTATAVKAEVQTNSDQEDNANQNDDQNHNDIDYENDHYTAATVVRLNKREEKEAVILLHCSFAKSLVWNFIKGAKVKSDLDKTLYTCTLHYVMTEDTFVCKLCFSDVTKRLGYCFVTFTKDQSTNGRKHLGPTHGNNPSVQSSILASKRTSCW